MTQRFIAITDHAPTVQWLQQALDGQGVVMHAEKRALSDVTALINIASASIVFVSLARSNLAQGTAFIEGLLAGKPMLAVIAVGDGLDNDVVLAAMRAGARDYITFGARSSEVMDMVRRVSERLPASSNAAVEQGQMLVMASPRPDTEAAFLLINMAVALQEEKPEASVLLLDLGMPHGDVMALLDMQASFSFVDAMRNLKRIDQTLIESAFPRHRSGIRILSLPAEGLDLDNISTAELFLLLGSLRGHFSHILVNACGVADEHFLALLIGNASSVVFLVEQTIVSCKQTLELMKKLERDSVPCENPLLVVDHYYPEISPDRSEIENSFGIKVAAVIPAAPETRLRVSNLGKTIFELAPKDFLAQKLRQLAGELLRTGTARKPSVSQRILGMLGRREA
ncbi:MAG: pilus assembly protein [Pedobacter sp.]|nr:pilus assembly protein [Pedobacter sp.]